PVSLLTITKPEFELLLGLVIVVLPVLAWRGEGPATAAVAVVLCLSPVMVQVGLVLAFKLVVGLCMAGVATIPTCCLRRVVAALWLKRVGRLALLAAAALNVMVAGGLSFWQGDRLTVIALPVWLLALTLSAAQILSRTQKAAA